MGLSTKPSSLNPFHFLPIPSSTPTTPPPPPLSLSYPPTPTPEPKPTTSKTQSNESTNTQKSPISNLISSIQSFFSSLHQPKPQTATGSQVDIEPGCKIPLFRPYVARLPWHGGARAFMSRLFPRYGHYCGPNWSSGKEGGSFLWDRRPLDWLDFCCYCHDMAYDTHDQARLLRADIAFFNCLKESRATIPKDGAYAAAIYRGMCLAGLKVVLIPYRTQLVRMQSGPPIMQVLSDLVQRIAAAASSSSSGRRARNEKQSV